MDSEHEKLHTSGIWNRGNLSLLIVFFGRFVVRSLRFFVDGEEAEMVSGWSVEYVPATSNITAEDDVTL